MQIGPVGVGDDVIGFDAAARVNRGGEEMGRRRLAVGAGDGRDLAWRDELGECLWSQGQCDLSPDRGS